MYFDNCGGDISAAVHGAARAPRHASSICGQISQYNAERPEPSFHPGALIVFRARMEGFLVTDYAHRFDEAPPRLARWVAEGKIRWRETSRTGSRTRRAAFIGMLNGENRGKALVRVADRD